MIKFNKPTKNTTQYMPENTENKDVYKEKGVHYETTRCRAINSLDTSIVFDIESDFKNHQILSEKLKKEFSQEINNGIITVTNTAGLIGHRFVFETVPKGTNQEKIDSILKAVENKYNHRIDYWITICK